MFKLVENSLNEAYVPDDNYHDYNKFHLRDYEEKIFSCREKGLADLVAVNSYFICPKKIADKNRFFILDSGQGYVVDKDQCRFAKCQLIDKHNLLMGRFSEAKSASQMDYDNERYLLNLKSAVLAAQLAWSTLFLRSVYGYLKNRKSNQGVLINKEIIQVLIGNVISHIKSAEKFKIMSEDFSREDISESQLLASQEIKSANQILAKLYGGRAFLAGSVVEMMMVFEYFKDIYFN